MKKVSIFSIAIFALITNWGLSAFAAGEGKISLSTLEGGYASTVQGTAAICLDPNTFVPESCGTPDVLVFPFTALAVGRSIVDSKGNSCATDTEVDTHLPVDASPPQVYKVNVAGKLLNYDPTSGSGDLSFTVYAGGKCNVAKFDSTGATVISSGTSHFVVSQRGNRWDGNFTSLTNPVNGVGGFSLSFIYYRQ
jgi:hypothetical protein